MNGDSIADLLIGAYWADPFGREDAGEAYLVFGRSSFQAVDDAANGEMIGRYRSRGDASKVVAKAAYEPEPWR